MICPVRSMIYGKFAKEKDELENANEIIRRVFTEEIGLEEEDEGDEFALSALIFSGDGISGGKDAGEESSYKGPVGAGRLLFDGKCFTIAETAILPEYRGRGYGDFLVRLLVDRAHEAGAGEIRLDALAGTEGFFGKIGFEPEGETFGKNGGRWQPMVLAYGQTCCNECQ